MKLISMITAMIILFLPYFSTAEELLLTSNKWLESQDIKVRLGCSLRGQKISSGSIRCFSEIMENLDNRTSFRADRVLLNSDGNFIFDFNGPTDWGHELFHLSGQVVKNSSGQFEILFENFKYRLKALDLFLIYDVEFSNFIASTKLFKPTYVNQESYDTQEKCKQYIQFEKSRLPRWCEFHGFSQVNIKFNKECALENNKYRVEQEAQCLN